MYPKNYLPRPSARFALAATVILSAPLVLPSAQNDDEEGPSSSAGPRVPALSVDGQLPSGSPEAPRAGTDRGLPNLEPFTGTDDSLPRPIRASYVPGELGDERVSEGAGDPFFLSFAGGSFHPPGTELVDPALAQRVLEPAGDGRPAEVTYAYVMLSKRVSPERLAELAGTGARPISFRPHQAFSVALDHASLAALSAHPSVRWVGFARTWQKLHPTLAETMQGAAPGARVPMLVSVFDDDRGAASVVEPVSQTEVAGPGMRRTEAGRGERWSSNGWQHAAMAELGVDVVEYLPSIRAFRVAATAEQAIALAERDFVEFVEPEMASLPMMHDDSMPMIGADYVRQTYDGNFSGEAIAGLIDSGFDVGHSALNQGWYLGWSLTGNSAWTDSCPHGSHVGGTILGLPEGGLDELTGAAPALGADPNRAFRSVKFMEPSMGGGNPCQNTGNSLESRFSLMRDTYDDGNIVAPKPHVVNNSWGTGATGGGWIGSEGNSRAVDSEIYDENQVYVFAAGNSGPGASTLSQEASAKNALSVGNVVPYESASSGLPGNIWVGNNASSIGPAGDGRWKPNVVAPGTNVVSVTAHTGNGYNAGTGTSMAAPHVTGVVAQMVDRHSFLRYRPERVASLVMATALTKANNTLSNPGETHLDTYGAGRIDAYRAVYTDSQHGWLNWGFSLGAAGQAWDEFNVSNSVERIVVVMHYIEPAASGGAGQALVNDFDMVLDYAPFSGPIDQGDYYAQQSGVNNTEIRAINNPTAGTWRWKIHPVSASSTVKMSVTVHFIYSDTTPEGSLSLSADDTYVKPGENVTLTATVGNTEHMASAVFVDTTGTENANLISATTELLDGAVADLTDNPANANGFEATLGNIRHGWTREVEWVVDWASEGVKTYSVDADSDNGMNRSASVDVTVDGTAPGVPGNLHSTSHSVNTWSNQDDVDFAWNTAFDSLSGVAGYGVFVSHGTGSPSAIQDLGAVNQTTEQMSSSVSPWYFNLRAVDRSGNWSASHATAGPYYIDTVDPEAVSGLISLTHLTNTWTNNPQIDVKWFAAQDAHSGIEGYGEFWSYNNPGAPSNTQDLGDVTSSSAVFGSSLSPIWYNLRSLDNAGNWDAHYGSAGPFLVDVDLPVFGSVTFWNEVAQFTETTSKDVILSIDAMDVHSGLAEIRVRNEGGFWSPWVPYQSTVNWDLTALGGDPETGTKTVHVEVRDQAGNVAGGSGDVYYYVPAQNFGSPCVGAQGDPRIYSKAIAKIGANVPVVVSNTDATLRRLMLGFSKEKYAGFGLPLDLGFLGAPGCELLVSQDLEIYSGAGSIANLVIPNDTGLVGLVAYLQWQLFGDSSGAPVVLTDGLEIYVNGL